MSDETPPPRLDYGMDAPRRKLLPSWVQILGGLSICVIVGSLFLPAQRKSYDNPSAECASNLHQIGLAILLYCVDNQGQYPDSFKTILLNEQVTSAAFVCPSSSDNPSTAPTTQAQADDMLKPGHASYIYLGKGFTDKTIPANAVVAYEPLSNHGNGMNVLCGDGHVEFVNTARGKAIIAGAAATRPVLLPP